MFKIYVGNLDYKVKVEQLRELFSVLAPIEDLVIPTDPKTNKAKGFAIVMIRDPELGHAAVKAMQGKRLMGRALVVNEAVKKKKSAAAPSKEQLLRNGPFGPRMNRFGDPRGGGGGGSRPSRNPRRSGPSSSGPAGRPPLAGQGPSAPAADGAVPSPPATAPRPATATSPRPADPAHPVRAAAPSTARAPSAPAVPSAGTANVAAPHAAPGAHGSLPQAVPAKADPAAPARVKAQKLATPKPAEPPSQH